MDQHTEPTPATRPSLSREVIEQLMSQVFEFAPNGVALTMLDGRIVLVNAELERMFGYSRADLLDNVIERLVPERFRFGHAMFRDGKSHDFAARTLGAGRELFGLRANGSEFPIEIGINALQTPNGPMVVETIIDVTVRKNLERLFERIVESAPCAMIMVDARGQIVLVNPQGESMFGYTRTELLGNSLELLLPESQRATHGARRQSFADAPEMRQMAVDREPTARRKDGSEFPVEIGLSPVPGAEDGLVLAAITDITRQKSMQLALRQANADLEQFTYAAAHDLKSPLRGIADLVVWIVEDLGGKGAPEVTRNLGRVSDRVRRLEKVIDDLLAYAHAGSKSTDTEPVDPEALIAAVLEILPRPAGFSISVEVTAKPFVTSKAPLESVLRNLVSNAVKHHDLPVGHIDIRVEDVGQYCVFTVSDDGPGIPPASQERVFQIFQTLASGAPEHSGIGLALSKRLAEAHGGWLKLEPASGVRGTACRVWWPRFQWSKTDE